MKARLFQPSGAENSDIETQPGLMPQVVRDAAQAVATLDEVEERLASVVEDDVPRSAAGEPNGRPPLPSRPKGRLLFAGVLLVLLGSVGFLLWDSFLRFEALGTVTGRIIEVPPPWPGTVEAVHVQIGETVELGEIVATLKSPELNDKIASVADELRVSKAELASEMAMLSFDSRTEHDRTRQALADYHALAGQRLQPKRSRVDQLESELERLRRKLESRTVRSPVAGRVIDIRHDVGEYIDPKQSLIAVMRRGSLELMVFVRQNHADRFVPGESIDVIVEPHSLPVCCRVSRLGEEYREAPKNFEKHFAHGEKVLPVYLSPIADQSGDLRLKLGAVVRLPYWWAPTAKHKS